MPEYAKICVNIPKSTCMVFVLHVHIARFDLTFATNLSFSNLMLGVEGRKILPQNNFPNQKITYFLQLLKTNFLFETKVS